jgi:chemotaxis protein CheY-P-specific phosphatase CheC
MANARRLAGDTESLREIAEIGSSSAARALARFLGRPILPRLPTARDAENWSAPGDWETCIVVEAEGDLTGLVALLIPSGTRETILRRLVGDAFGTSKDEVATSALREFGNILASQTVSAIANALDGRILLSVPDLLTDTDASALDERVASRLPRICIETELRDTDGVVYALLVLIPDPPA